MKLEAASSRPAFRQAAISVKSTRSRCARLPPIRTVCASALSSEVIASAHLPAAGICALPGGRAAAAGCVGPAAGRRGTAANGSSGLRTASGRGRFGLQARQLRQRSTLVIIDVAKAQVNRVALIMKFVMREFRFVDETNNAIHFLFIARDQSFR